MVEIKIKEDCKKCRICSQVCPMGVFTYKDKTSISEATYPEVCISCGHCISMCNQKSIIHSGIGYDQITPINNEMLPNYDQTLELIKSRRSLRVYSNKPIEKELVTKIVDAARFAPSAENSQTTRYIVVTNKEILKRISFITADFVKGNIDSLKEKMSVKSLNETEIHSLNAMSLLLEIQSSGRDMFLFDTPCFLIFHAKTDAVFAEVNANLALQNASLAALSLGIGSFWTGYVVSASRNNSDIKKLLNVPAENAIFGGLAIGYAKYKFKNWIQRKDAVLEWIN